MLLVSSCLSTYGHSWLVHSSTTIFPRWSARLTALPVVADAVNAGAATPVFGAAHAGDGITRLPRATTARPEAARNARRLSSDMAPPWKVRAAAVAGLGARRPRRGYGVSGSQFVERVDDRALAEYLRQHGGRAGAARGIEQVQRNRVSARRSAAPRD